MKWLRRISPAAAASLEEGLEAARSGQAVPDGNGVFGQLRFPVLNNAGQVAFDATLAATFGGSSDDRGIYFYDARAGRLQVARSGDPFLGSSITQLGMAFTIDPAYDERKSINNMGQLAFLFTLADGRRGIAIWMIPEPTSMVLLAVGTGLIAISGRRRR